MKRARKKRFFSQMTRLAQLVSAEMQSNFGRNGQANRPKRISFSAEIVMSEGLLQQSGSVAIARSRVIAARGGLLNNPKRSLGINYVLLCVKITFTWTIWQKHTSFHLFLFAVCSLYLSFVAAVSSQLRLQCRLLCSILLWLCPDLLAWLSGVWQTKSTLLKMCGSFCHLKTNWKSLISLFFFKFCRYITLICHNDNVGAVQS